MPVLSAAEFKCLVLIIRKTRGWHKQADAISVGQLREGTGIKKPHTVHAAIDKLVAAGWIEADKARGKMTVYRLGRMFGEQCQQTAPVPANGTGSAGEPVDKPVPANGTGCDEPVPVNGTGVVPFSGMGVVPFSGTLQNSNLQNTTTQNGGAGWFSEIYPLKVDLFDLVESWGDLDQVTRSACGQGLDELRPMIESDIRQRAVNDRRWLAGYIPTPINYIRKRLWLEQIVAVPAVEPRDPDELVIPRADNDLLDWARRHEYPAPFSGEDWGPYRQRLARAVGQRRQDRGAA